MSAFVVSDTHLSLLVDALRRERDLRYRFGPTSVRRSPSAMAPQDLFAMLFDENVASVSYRYSEEPGSYEPGRYQQQPIEMTDPETLNAVACYEYQSCEHPGWEASEARAAMRSLEGEIVGRIASGPWGWEPEDVRQRAVDRGRTILITDLIR